MMPERCSISVTGTGLSMWSFTIPVAPSFGSGGAASSAGGGGGLVPYPGPADPGWVGAEAEYFPFSTSETCDQGMTRGWLWPASRIFTLVPGSDDTTVPRIDPPFLSVTSSGPGSAASAVALRERQAASAAAATFLSREAEGRRII